MHGLQQYFWRLLLCELLPYQACQTSFMSENNFSYSLVLITLLQRTSNFLCSLKIKGASNSVHSCWNDKVGAHHVAEAPQYQLGYMTAWRIISTRWAFPLCKEVFGLGWIFLKFFYIYFTSVRMLYSLFYKTATRKQLRYFKLGLDELKRYILAPIWATAS